MTPAPDPQPPRNAQDGAIYRKLIPIKTRPRKRSGGSQDTITIRIAVYPDEPVTIGVGPEDPATFSKVTGILTQDALMEIVNAFNEAIEYADRDSKPKSAGARGRATARTNRKAARRVSRKPAA